MTRARWVAAGIGLALMGVAVRGEMTPALRTLVDQDRAFAKASAARTTQEAFLEFLADDSLLFRPGPVPGKMFTRNRPSPPGKLTWAPTVGLVAGSGELGMTAGPWEYRKAELTEAPSSFGHYLSIWRLQKDGQYRLEVQLNVTHDKFTTAVADVKEVDSSLMPLAPAGKTAAPVKSETTKAAAAAPASAKPAPATTGAPSQGSVVQPAGAKTDAAKPVGTSAGAAPSPASTATDPRKPAGAMTAPTSVATPAMTSGPQPQGGASTAPLSPAKQAEEQLKDVDRAFAKAASEPDGAVKAFQAAVVDNVRLYRNNTFPIVGKAAIAKVAANDLGTMWQPTHARVSASGDIGYTTGLISLGPAAAPGSRPQPHYYVRVWRRDASGTWKMVLDMVS